MKLNAIKKDLFLLNITSLSPSSYYIQNENKSISIVTFTKLIPDSNKLIPVHVVYPLNDCSLLMWQPQV